MEIFSGNYRRDNCLKSLFVSIDMMMMMMWMMMMWMMMMMMMMMMLSFNLKLSKVCRISDLLPLLTLCRIHESITTPNVKRFGHPQSESAAACNGAHVGGPRREDAYILLAFFY
jgi:hypothetical protein